MANNKIVSVWLELDDGKNKGKIALQKRSAKNKIGPFVCQPTWSGKVEGDEDLDEATERECKEELGTAFCTSIDFSKLEMSYKGDFVMKNEDWSSYNYFDKIKEKFLQKIKMHKEALPEIIYVGKTDEFYSLNSGKDPKTNVVLFDDQYKILKKILNK